MRIFRSIESLYTLGKHSSALSRPLRGLRRSAATSGGPGCGSGHALFWVAKSKVHFFGRKIRSQKKSRIFFIFCRNDSSIQSGCFRATPELRNVSGATPPCHCYMIVGTRDCWVWPGRGIIRFRASFRKPSQSLEHAKILRLKKCHKPTSTLVRR